MSLRIVPVSKTAFAIDFAPDEAPARTPEFEPLFAVDFEPDKPGFRIGKKLGELMLIKPGDKTFAVLARRLAVPNEPKTDVARRFGISRQTVWRILASLRKQGFNVK